tara:strand:- start:2606 stop:3349 length:744 start_codon:yes stop_codon:yes gene_type:complete
MSFWNSALGAMIGFSLGGPIGGLIGGVIGSKLGGQKAHSSSRSNFTNTQKQQAAFFAALFACLAKIAKSDGVITKEEIDKVEIFIKDRFKLSSDDRQYAIDVFNHAKDDQVSYEEYAAQLASLLGNNTNALIMFYELLFELAMADGVLDESEEALLRKTPNIFKLDFSLFEQMLNKFSAGSKDPYKILGVDRESPFIEIKKVYQKKRREFHPDTLVSKGLPEELINKAKEKFIEIQSAFEEIEKKQG